MATVSEYLQTQKLKLSTTEMVSVVFRLHNKEAKRVNYNNEADTSSHFAKRWRHTSHSWGGLLAEVLEQQRCEQPH